MVLLEGMYHTVKISLTKCMRVMVSFANVLDTLYLPKFVVRMSTI